MLEILIVVGFSFFNTIRVFSYLPQIMRIARDTGGAAAVSYLTWTMWFCANFSSAAYAGVIIGDRALAIVSAVNTLCCAIVIVLTKYKRRSFRATALAAAAAWSAHCPMSFRRTHSVPALFQHFFPHIGPPPG